MKVIFLEDVPRVGRMGEVKEVANGHARNFLIPKKLAVLATPAELQRWEAKLKASALHQARSEEELQGLAQRLEGMTVTLRARTGPQGRLYGSITNADIAEELNKLTSQEIDRRKIELEEPIREVGEYEVTVRLLSEVAPKIRVIVEEEEA